MLEDNNKFAEENMSYNTPDGKPPDHRQILIDLIASAHGPQAAVVADSALKHQDKQIKEAMSQGMTAEQIMKSSGIDINNITGQNKKKGNFLHTPFQVDPTTGEVTPESILGGLIKSHPDDVLTMVRANQLVQGSNPEASIQKMADLQKKIDEVLPGYKVDQTADGRFIINSGASGDLNLGMKEEQFKQKRLQTMGDDLDPSKNVRNPYGVAQLGLSRAERIEGLVSQYKDLNLDAREMEELAIGLNSMLQGSNISSQKQVMGLIPRSAVGNVQRMKEWLENNPQGLNQQKFVERMLNDVRREKQVFQGQVMKFARSKVAKYSDLLKKYPEETNDILKSFNVDPEAYAQWKSNGFKDSPPIELSGGNDNIQSNGWDDSKEKRYQELLNKRQGK